MPTLACHSPASPPNLLIRLAHPPVNRPPVASTPDGTPDTHRPLYLQISLK